eukprot:6187242-Pleurochrysis_carterae.AAC.2
MAGRGGWKTSTAGRTDTTGADVSRGCGAHAQEGRACTYADDTDAETKQVHCACEPISRESCVGMRASRQQQCRPKARNVPNRDRLWLEDGVLRTRKERCRSRRHSAFECVRARGRRGARARQVHSKRVLPRVASRRAVTVRALCVFVRSARPDARARPHLERVRVRDAKRACVGALGVAAALERGIRRRRLERLIEQRVDRIAKHTRVHDLGVDRDAGGQKRAKKAHETIALLNNAARAKANQTLRVGSKPSGDAFPQVN